MSETISFTREDSLTAVQRELAEVLRADSLLANVAVIDSSAGDTATDVDEALHVFAGRNSKVGACVIVRPVTGRLAFPEMRGGPLTLGITVQVLESVKANAGSTGTGLAALSIATRVFRVLHLYQPWGLLSALSAQTPVIASMPQPPAGADVGYEVQFEGQEAGYESDVHVAEPTFTIVPGSPDTVVLACATSGSAIYFTTDGSHPRVGNTTATLYTTPIPVTGISRLRARAFKAGLLASDTPILTIS